MQAYYREDQELVRRLKQGDQEAFQELYQKYHSKIYYHTLKFTKSPALAEDVVHDVFVRIWEGRNALKEELSFQSYLFTLAKNHLLNLLKRASREADILQEMIAHTQVALRTTENSLSYRETSEMISKAIEKLPVQRKRIYELCRQEGLSYEEVARKLGITKGTVNSQMVKSLKSIKDYLTLNGNSVVSITFTLLIL